MSITRNTQIFAEKAGKYTISATVQNFWYIYIYSAGNRTCKSRNL